MQNEWRSKKSNWLTDTVKFCASTILWGNRFQNRTVLNRKPLKTLSTVQVFRANWKSWHCALQQQLDRRIYLVEHQKRLWRCRSRWQDQTEPFDILQNANWTLWGELCSLGQTAQEGSCKKLCEWNISELFQLVLCVCANETIRPRNNIRVWGGDR